MWARIAKSRRPHRARQRPGGRRFHGRGVWRRSQLRRARARRADPGTMLVTATVRRQVAGLFIVEDRGPHELKGVPGRPHYTGSRAPAAAAGAPAPAPIRRLSGAKTISQSSSNAGSAREPARGSSFRSSASPASASRVSSRNSQPARRNAALLGRMDRFAIVAEHRAASIGRVGQAALRRRPLGGAATRRPRTSLTQVKLNPAEFAPLLAPLLDIPAESSERLNSRRRTPPAPAGRDGRLVACGRSRATARARL